MELLEFLGNQFSAPVAERLGAQIGLAPSAARQALNALWPLQLDALITHTQATHIQAPASAQQMLDLAASVPGGPVSTLLERPGSLNDLERLGRSAAPLLLESNEEIINEQVASATQAPLLGVSRLGQLSLLLLLKLLLEHARSNSLGASGMSAVLLAQRPRLAALLPTALAPLIGTFAASSTPVHPTAPPEDREDRRGAGWLWALPLALLLLAGGCFLATRNRDSTAQGPATGEAAGALRITEPGAGATLPAAAFTLHGSGKAGEPLSVREGAAQLAAPSVAADGTWSADLPAPVSGPHIYTVQGTSSDTAQVAITVGTGAGTATAQTASSTATGTAPGAADTGKVNTSVNSSAASAPTINAPGGNVTGTFDLTGSGVAGQTVTIYEDGADIGTATVDAGGQWTLKVPSPAAGARQYEVRSAGGRASTRVTVEAASGSAACAQNFTLSLQDGQNVTSPFRFGGQGAGAGYNVSVKRGERTVGSKVLPLSTACGWSYTSNPGKGEISYVVRPGTDRTATPISTITLNVK